MAVALLGKEGLQRRYRRWITGLIRQVERRGADLAEPVAERIIRDLNERTGRGYRVTRQVVAMIRVLLVEGYIVEDFIRVHEVKGSQWLADEKMSAYLRPSTLYRKRHFDEYLAEWAEFDVKRRERTEKSCRSPAHLSRAESVAAGNKDAELMKRKWWEFDRWSEFVKWTSELSSAEALARYEMPDLLRALRETEGSLMKVATGKCPAWVDKEYDMAKCERSEN